MQIILNGKLTEINAMTIQELLLNKGIDVASVIVEYNQEILKKEIWPDITLQENDTLEVLRFVGGG